MKTTNGMMRSKKDIQAWQPGYFLCVGGRVMRENGLRYLFLVFLELI